MARLLMLTEEDLAQLAPTDQEHARQFAELPEGTRQLILELLDQHSDDWDVHSNLAIKLGVGDYQLGFDERLIEWVRRNAS